MSAINASDSRAVDAPDQPSPANTDPKAKRKQMIVLAIASLITIILCVLSFRYHHQIESLGNYGLFGLFALSVLNNATFMIPVPFASVIGCSVSLKYGAIMIGIVMGLGGAIGEITGYMAGYGGSGIIPNNLTARRIENWVRRWGTLAIVLLALVPNPFFDIGGVVAGMLRMGWLKFIGAAWLGKGLRMLIMGLACSGLLPRLFHW